VEILLVVALLSLIMLALMAVFNATQTAFKASVTQTDILQGGRASMDLMAGDFRQMVPSGGNCNNNPFEPLNYASDPPTNNPVNFWLSTPEPTIRQSLVGTSASQERTNQVQAFFILSCQNQVWKGVGYFVDTDSTNYIYPLYRYDSTWLSVTSRPSPVQIFMNFQASLTPPVVESATPGLHHLMDGVLHLNVRAYGTNGVWLTNGYPAGGFPTNQIVIENTTFFGPMGGDVALLMCSNTLPAAVDIQMAVLEDRALSRAASFGLNPGPSFNSNLNYSNYLAQQAGKLHLFRQRVTIPNVDPNAYQ
jgi:hypothetical protein